MVTYTSSPLYWSPLKPRINMYTFADKTYSSPLYTYDAFTDVGVDTKPIGLNFDSSTSNVGSFAIEIEDKDYALDPDIFMKGNRVSIEVSKDGDTWQTAFKGLVRGTDQTVYAESGRNFIVNGFSYLIRLNERIVNFILEGVDRNDSSMFTNFLIDSILTDDSNYVYAPDDTNLYDIFRYNNIINSQIRDWVPKVDAQLVTLNDALNSILEFSNSLLMINPVDDQLLLYNTELDVPITSNFLLTNVVNDIADDADRTMYPLEPYKYNISYDYPDSGSRLIGSIGEVAGSTCPDIVDTPTTSSCTTADTILMPNGIPQPFTALWYSGSSGLHNGMMAIEFQATQTSMSGFRVECANTSAMAQGDLKAQVRTGAPSLPNTGTSIGSTMTLYHNRIVGNPFPNFECCSWYAGLEVGADGATGLTVGQRYWVIVWIDLDFYASNLQWGILPRNVNAADRFFYTKNESGWPNPAAIGWDYSTLTACGNPMGTCSNGPFTALMMDFGDDIIQEECGGGGSQATKDADPVFAVVEDLNMTNRLGVVERAITNIPIAIKDKEALLEYLGNKLYTAAKPRFTFDFPSVSMPNRLPKAGDIVTHVDSKVRVGTRTAPIQTGVISEVRYAFEQGSGTDDALGLRRFSVQTTGIRRGSY